jgi:hypothetical protein
MTKSNALVMALAVLALVALIASCGPGPDGACVIKYTSSCILDCGGCQGTGACYTCKDGVDKSTCEADGDAGNVNCVSMLDCAEATVYPNETCGEVDCGPNQLCPPDED